MSESTPENDQKQGAQDRVSENHDQVRQVEGTNRSVLRMRLLLLGTVILVALLVLSIFFLTPDKVLTLRVNPQEVSRDVMVNTIEGTTFQFGDSLWLYTSQAVIDVTHPGYRGNQSVISASAGPTIITVDLEPLPGILDIEVIGDLDFQVLLNNKPISQLIGIELAKGTYSVDLLYQSEILESQSVDIKGLGARELLQFKLTQYQSSVTLAVEPKSATIKIDNLEVGQGYLQQNIQIGTHTVDIELPAYQSAKITFTADVGEQVDLGTINLRPSPVRVSITTNPKAASILVDDKFVAESNTQFDLLPNKQYTIEAIKPGFGEQQVTVKPEIGKPISKHFNFLQSRVKANITIKPKGSIFVNGVDRGPAPQIVELEHQDVIEAKQSGLETESISINLAHGLEQNIRFDLFSPGVAAFRKAPQRMIVQGGLVLEKFPEMTFSKLISQNPDQFSEIKITRPFYLSTTETTAKAYHLFKKTNQQEEDFPITQISWIDAVRFCNWLSQESKLNPVYELASGGVLANVNSDSLGFRLPTEIEWEAGASYDWRNDRVNEPFEWGNRASVPFAFANISGRERSQTTRQYLDSHNDNHIYIAPAGHYPPNANGLHDMTGNLSEWVHDYFDYRRIANLPAGYFDQRLGLARTIKGGNYTVDDIDQLRVHYRNFEEADHHTVGFRIAKWIY